MLAVAPECEGQDVDISYNSWYAQVQKFHNKLYLNRIILGMIFAYAPLIVAYVYKVIECIRLQLYCFDMKGDKCLSSESIFR